MQEEEEGQHFSSRPPPVAVRLVPHSNMSLHVVRKIYYCFQLQMFELACHKLLLQYYYYYLLILSTHELLLLATTVASITQFAS